MLPRTLAKIERPLANAEATDCLGQELAKYCRAPLILNLSGVLGAGKTTLVRAMLRAWGVTGAIKSPTFALLEPYELANGNTVLHFDLYRLNEPEELDYIGIRDYLNEDCLCLIEWPERGAGYLPEPDLTCFLQFEKSGRLATLEANSERGESVLKNLAGS